MFLLLINIFMNTSIMVIYISKHVICIMKCKLCNPRGGWIGILKFMQYNSHNNLIYCLYKIKTINSIKHNIKRVREEKTNTRIFTWFGYPRLRPHLQAHLVWGFHYPSLPRLQMFTIDFQGVNEPLQQEIISLISSPQVFPTLAHSQFDKKWNSQQ